jgi:DNA-3-methyladenine glycosylase
VDATLSFAEGRRDDESSYPRMSSVFIGRAFFERPPDDVAHDLIGALIVVRSSDHTLRARLTECEAYGGLDDPASHAYRGPTPRSAIMFGPAGFLYVYLSYGIHWCMNVVTSDVGTPSAVLLRGADVQVKADDPTIDATMKSLRGPGNLTRGLGVSGDDNGVDCCRNSDGRVSFWTPLATNDEDNVGRSTRIGLTKEKERLSRYFLLPEKPTPGTSAAQ